MADNFIIDIKHSVMKIVKLECPDSGICNECYNMGLLGREVVDNL